MMGHAYAGVSFRVKMAEEVTRKKVDRRVWFPVRTAPDGTARIVTYHGSAHINALCEADGLLDMPKGVGRIEKGEEVAVRQI